LWRVPRGCRSRPLSPPRKDKTNEGAVVHHPKVKWHPEMGKACGLGDMVMLPVRPQEVLVSMATEMISRQRSLTLLALVPHRKVGHPINGALVVVSGSTVHS